MLKFFKVALKEHIKKTEAQFLLTDWLRMERFFQKRSPLTMKYQLQDHNFRSTDGVGLGWYTTTPVVCSQFQMFPDVSRCSGSKRREFDLQMNPGNSRLVHDNTTWAETPMDSVTTSKMVNHLQYGIHDIHSEFAGRIPVFWR